ncbi:MAG: hypothetical protein DRR19_07775 [Candidatus Parabeggiatoa sp. nov. 1]|nr:MAG: hypothetical protein DRR19_07775 [Gammaproteobacteria bacterium]
MITQSLHQQTLQAALDAFIQTATMEEALDIIQQYPDLLSDQADILLGSIINNARKQGETLTAQALDERRDFIRSVRQERL